MVSEQRAFNERLVEAGRRMPPPGQIPVDTIRRNRIEGGGGLPRPPLLDHGTERSIEVDNGAVPVRILVPDEPLGVYVHCHGGGWVLGSIWEQDVMLWSIARHVGVTTVTVGYRLAPEHPHPAGLDDVAAVMARLLDGTVDGIGGGPLLVGGESAGAHLATLALLRLRDSGVDVRTAVAGVQLGFGIFDLGMTPSQVHWGDRFLTLSTPYLEWFYDQYAPGATAARRREPDLSPLSADLTGLPPALFTVGTLDPLLDDSLLMAERWRDAGNEAELSVHPEGAHGFTVAPTAMGRMASRRIQAFLAWCLAERAADEARR